MKTQTEFEAIDMARGKAHNSVSQSIGEVLQLPGWSLEDYRQFVAKMRDERFASKKSEIDRYSSDILGQFSDSDIQLQLMGEDLSGINEAIAAYNHLQES